MWAERPVRGDLLFPLSGDPAMSAGDGRRQRAVMATDAEWERIGRLAGMDRSRYLVHRALAADALPDAVLRRAVRETLVLSLLEERRLRRAGAGPAWDDACDAVDEWIEGEGVLDRLTDPGAANRWKAAGVPEAEEDAPGSGPGPCWRRRTGIWTRRKNTPAARRTNARSRRCGT